MKSRTSLLLIGFLFVGCGNSQQGGKTQTSNPNVLAVSVVPDIIDPGDTIEVEYLLSGDVSKITGVELSIPALSGSPWALPIPPVSGASGNNGVQASAGVTIAKPAADNHYNPVVTISYSGGSSFQVGSLTIRDKRTKLSDVRILPSEHSLSSNCQNADQAGYIEREVHYKVEDDNGLLDVNSPQIFEVLPLVNSVPITESGIVFLQEPQGFGISATADTMVRIRCEIDKGTYTLKILANEVDTPDNDRSMVTATEEITYTVTQ